MNTVLLEPQDLDARAQAVLADRRADHLLRVLRVERGRRLRAGLLNGLLGEIEVVATDSRTVTVRWEEGGASPEMPDLSLVLALPRPKVLKRLYRPLAEMGVKEIMLTDASRVEKCYFDSHAITPECYAPRLREGLEQAGHTRLPEVTVHRALHPLIELHLGAGDPQTCRILARPASAADPAAVARSREAGRVLLAVGPEGGWIDDEVELFHRHGFVDAGIGPLPLRSDTACIALLAILGNALRPARAPGEKNHATANERE